MSHHVLKAPLQVNAIPQHQSTAIKKRDYAKFAVPILVVAAVCCLVGVSTFQWDTWTAGADIQVTDNAYVRSDLSHLSAQVSGNVVAIQVSDFAHIKSGDVVLQIDPALYVAKVDEASAALDSAKAQLRNLDNQVALEEAAIAQTQAQLLVANANAALAKTEASRQVALLEKGAGVQQKKEQAEAELETTTATARASVASVSSAKAQLQYIEGQRAQLLANVASAEAGLRSSKLSLSYTTIRAPFDGVVGERQVRIGDYVTAGTNIIPIVSLPNVYLIANFKETQLSRMRREQSVDITVDSLPGERFSGKVSSLSPASGSQFALLPADNATGNFTKVVQRIPVRIDFDPSAKLDHLRSGMSAVVRVAVQVDK
jgi:membrane fusion protein (multidrug efflux system)